MDRCWDALEKRLRALFSEPVFDPQRRRLAGEYARAQRTLALVHVLITFLYWLFWVITPAGVYMGKWARSHFPGRVIAVIAVYLIVGGGWALIHLLISILSHMLARRYGQSVQGWEEWVTDWVKSILLEGGILGVFVVSIELLVSTGSALWWLWAALGGIAFLLFLTIIAPVGIAPLFFHFEPLEDEELRTRFLNLAQRAGVPVLDVYRFDLSTRTRAANAAILGLGSTRRIVVGDTLLTHFPPEEAEAILAHELAHHVHKDVVLSFFLEGGMLLVSFRVLDAVLQWSAAAWGVTKGDPALVPVIMFTLFSLQLLFSPLLNLWSRSREALADMVATVLVDSGKAYARALARLADQNLAELCPPKWYVWFFGSHPPLAERIAMALAYEENSDVKEETTHEPNT